MAKWTPEAHDAAEQRLRDTRDAIAEAEQKLSRAMARAEADKLAAGLDLVLRPRQ